MRKLQFLLILLLGLCTQTADADKLCIKKTVQVKNGKVKLSPTLRAVSACPSGFLEVLDTASFQGPAGSDGANGTNGAAGAAGTNGTNGTNGVDGALALYGDASGGNLTISSDTTLSATDLNLQYDNITVSSGATWTVPSGTYLRCTGTMTVEGTIAVSPGARGGEMTVPPGFLYTSQPLTTARLAHPGIGLTSALFGKISVDSATTITQSDSDRSRGASTAYHLGSLLKHAAWGGGGGGGNSGSIGGSGGGRLTVLCQGAVSIAAGGIVTAYGEGGSGNGAGGGGGGVIVLASATSVTNSGNIIADGGDGADGDASRAPGGGGGGGLIAMIAPSVSAPGTESVDGGLGAPAVTNINTTPRQSGANGGASFGNGGNGGSIPSGGNVTPTAGGPGASGSALTQASDPTALFM